MEDFSTLEGLSVGFLLASYVIAIISICMAQKPLSRPGYVGRFFILIGVLVIAVIILGSGGIALGLVLIGLTNILQLHFNARRFVDLDWSKWWFLTIITGIGTIVVTFLPFFFASRRSVGLEPEHIVKVMIVENPEQATQKAQTPQADGNEPEAPRPNTE